MMRNGSIVDKAKRPWLAICALGTLIPAGFAQTVAPSEPAPPAQVSELEHTPPQLPTVTFHDGELTIIANNSSLQDVLEMVRKQTGAAIDEIPPEANERVFVKLGPGPTRRVLDTLLAGSNLNYVLLGSATDPQALTKVVLSVKPSGNTDNGTVADAMTPAQRRLVQRQPQTSVEDAEPASPPVVDKASAEIVPGNNTVKAENAAKGDNAAKTEPGDKTETADAAAQAPADNGQTAAADYPRTPNIRTAQEVLQDLYSRRQAMQQQQQQQQQTPPQ